MEWRHALTVAAASVKLALLLVGAFALFAGFPVKGLASLTILAVWMAFDVLIALLEDR